MKKLFVLVALIISTISFSQDVNVTLKEAQNFERSLKEDKALDKYNEVIAADPKNVEALVKCAELIAATGARQKDKKDKKVIFETAKSFADRAFAIAPDNADVNYVMSLSASKLADVETENKKLIAYIKDARTYADKALAINPNHAKANYALGKWHFEMVQTSWVKKTAAKALFGGLPESKIEDAFKYMEKCRSLDQYYVANYLELAKAYKYDNKPAKAIEVLQKLVKLPNRTADDANLKSEGKTMLNEML